MDIEEESGGLSHVATSTVAVIAQRHSCKFQVPPDYNIIQDLECFLILFNLS